MSIFTNHKLSFTTLLKEIPESLFNQFSEETKVDSYTKVLHGKIIFCLLLYSLLLSDRLGQRGMADLFASSHFKMLFNLSHTKKKISHSSISERLSVIKVDYFRKLYESIYKRFSTLYPSDKICGLQLHRVDSSLVSEASNKLKEGLNWGNTKQKGKMIKYTINYDGIYGSFVKFHTEEAYTSESLALPENVLEHFKKQEDHSSVYILDRGQSSTRAFGEMQSKKGLLFVGRLVENRKLHIIKELDLTFKSFSSGQLKQDAIIQLYGTKSTTGENGKQVRSLYLAEERYRVIRFRPQDKNEDILLITNIFNMRADTIAQIYRRRWDIEVFFRFLKQEVNFSHFISLNKNGIEVMMYMTMIAAMLIMIYRKENDLGFKTAKRRMTIELQELILSITVVLSGGDLKKTCLSSP